MIDPRYAPWLVIAEELAALHGFVYSESGPFYRFRESPCKPTGLEAANWLRKKCATGRWYWWDKTTLAGRAEEPLRSIQRIVGDGGGLYEASPGGPEMLDRIRKIQEHVAAVAAG